MLEFQQEELLLILFISVMVKNLEMILLAL